MKCSEQVVFSRFNAKPIEMTQYSREGGMHVIHQERFPPTRACNNVMEAHRLYFSIEFASWLM